MAIIHSKWCLGLFAIIAFLLASCAVQEPAAPEIHPAQKLTGSSANHSYRKNIDELSAAELAAFEHAVAVLKKKSQDNVFDRTGFIWQSWVHNCTSVVVPNTRQAGISAADMQKYLLSQATPDSCNTSAFLNIKGMKTHTERPGECEHQKNTFLQWHRAQLYFYEQALQAADPEGKTGPSTKNVTLPFWNFTQKPSGARYPAAFENPASPLFDSTRTHEPLASSLPTSSPYLLAYMLYYDDWINFGGDEYGNRGGGNLETKIHNRMHAIYINGHMANNQTAALDPIFYVFHNFLDYSFEKWIEINNTQRITGGDFYLRGEQDIRLPKPQGYDPGSNIETRADSADYLPNMGQGSIYYDTKKQGYAFAPSTNGDFIPKPEIQRLIDKHQQAGFVFGNQQSLFSALLSYGSSREVEKPQVVLYNTYKIPASIKPADIILLAFSRQHTQPDYSFLADVYLYPQSVKENIASEDFRSRYLVTNTAHWGLSGAHGGHDISVQLNVKDVINSLINNKSGETWNIALAISRPDQGKVLAGDFSPPSIVINPDTSATNHGGAH